MPEVYETGIMRFRGTKEDDNPLRVKSDGDIETFSRVLQSLRPMGGKLQKNKGRDLSTIVGYKLGNRPVELIRFSRELSVGLFICLIWDNIVLISGTVYTPLCKPGKAYYAGNVYLIPSNTLRTSINVGNNGIATVNQPADHLIYKDVLYITDGVNRPMKTDGTYVGEWGMRKFSNADSPLSIVQQKLEDAAYLTNGTYKYKITLYDSTRSLESHIGDISEDIDVSAVGDDKARVWIHVNMVSWAIEDNYDFENEFADQIRLYRSPAVGGAAHDDPPIYCRIAATETLKKGLISWDDDGTKTVWVEDNGATGTVHGINTKWADDGVSKYDAIYLTAAGVFYQIIDVVSNAVLTVVDPDGNDYTGGDLITTHFFLVFAGYIDDTDDLSDDGGGADSANIPPITYYGDSSSDLYGNSEDSDHGVPERCKYCVMHQERAFIAGDPDHPNRVYYSQIGIMDYFPIEYYHDISPDDGDRITGLIVFGGRLLVWKRNSVAFFDTRNEIASWSVTEKYLSVGVPDKHLIADCEGILMWANTTGVYAWDGGNLRRVSHTEDRSNVIDTWRKVINIQDARAVYHKERGEFWLAVTLDDERDLYDDSLTGFGIVNEPDDIAPP